MDNNKATPKQESYANFRRRVLLLIGKEAPVPEEKPEVHPYTVVESTTLYYTNPAENSDKVYTVELVKMSKSQYAVNFAYGPRGGKMKSGTKTPTAVDEFDAKRKYRKLIAEKQNGGYVRSIDGGLR